MKIVILERNTVGADVDVSAMEQFGEVAVYTDTTPETVAERVKDADIIVANKMPLNENTLKDAANVKLIEEFATGYDNIDIEYCRSRNIAVCNVSNYSTDSVVQHTFAMALSLMESLPWYDNFVKSGGYSASGIFTYFGKEFSQLSSLTWGVAGMGNIGKKVALVARAFGAEVVCYSTSGVNNVIGYKFLDKEAFFSQCDIISLHCPLNDRTRHLVNEKTLSLMKPSAILINVARGAVVDSASLANALDEGMIAAAGVDVMEKEPIAADDPLMHVKNKERLLLTPHMAWASREARQKVVSEACKNIEAYLAGEERNRIV
ncbi:MAG: D-2-hydroxyacid dehydrogenase [Lachnospiraceae bacterium]|nr:D-2-hydroxyacid dehydrogenase [Lachnospiraceae bacterium]